MRKKLVIGIILLALLVSLSASAVYLRTHPRFPADTVICETDVSNKFVSGASSLIRETLDAYTVTVDIGTAQHTFTSNDISLQLDESALEQLASKLELGITDVDYTSAITFDAEPIRQWLCENLDENRIEPVGAHLVWNPETDLFELDGGVVGEYNDADNALQVVVNGILRLDDNVTLTEADYHVEYTDPQQVAAEQEALEYANTLVSRELTYGFYQRTGEYAAEVISPAMIGSWLIVEKDGLSLSWNENSIHRYAEEKAAQYAISGEANFVSHDNRDIDLTVNAPTNLVDAEALSDDIFTSLVNMESGERTVPYTEQNLFRNYDGTYIEISIGEQRLYAYLDGELFVETGIITGCMHCDHGTKTGIFKVQNRDRNIYLQGDNYYVHYWMGFFIPKYGMHDADGWREPEEYGTDKYLTDGSGGCVNIPREVIAQMYETFDVGTPVIIYDESYVITDDTVTE